jgi:hypothetical protein
MTWATKNLDWQQLVTDIQSEINANKEKIPEDRIKCIQHYLDHDEYAMAFEFLYLEIIERNGATCTLGKEKAQKIALMLDLDKEMNYDQAFWKKFQKLVYKVR